MMGDILSKGTCPEGDDRDTPIGGVSRLSPVPSVGSVPGLVVIDSPTDLDGDPLQEWAWDLGAETNLFAALFPRPDPESSTDHLSPAHPVRAGSLTREANASNMPPINEIPHE
jgi:hypothetical protein